MWHCLFLLFAHIFQSLKLVAVMHKGKPGNWSTLAYHSRHWSSHIWRTSGGTAHGVCLPISSSAMLRKFSSLVTFIITLYDHMVKKTWCLILGQKVKMSERILNRIPLWRKRLLCSLPRMVLECCFLLPELSHLLVHWNQHKREKQIFTPQTLAYYLNGKKDAVDYITVYI